jgi:hypothetical protein
MNSRVQAGKWKLTAEYIETDAELRAIGAAREHTRSRIFVVHPGPVAELTLCDADAPRPTLSNRDSPQQGRERQVVTRIAAWDRYQNLITGQACLQVR